MSASLLVPRSPEDLAARHRCFDRVARYSMGMLGRTPDYVNVTLAGFVARSDIFSLRGDTTFAERIQRFHREVIEKDLSLTHTIIHPAIDKTLGDVEGVNGEVATRVLGRTSNGIVVRGAKILATLGPFADELFVYPGQPLPPTADPSYALAFSIPLKTKGLITLCRDHYGVGGSVADHPFSSRFDEQDAFDNPEFAPKIEHYMRGAGEMGARERAKLFRTAWDFAGSALGGRVELYERFYLASAPRNLALDHRFAQAQQEWTGYEDLQKAIGGVAEA